MVCPAYRRPMKIRHPQAVSRPSGETTLSTPIVSVGCDVACVGCGVGGGALGLAW